MFFLLFLNEVTRKLKIMYVAHIAACSMFLVGDIAIRISLLCSFSCHHCHPDGYFLPFT